MLLELLIFILTALCLLIGWATQIKWKYRSLRQQFSGPYSLPIIGNVHQFGFNAVAILRNLSRLADSHGNTYTMNLGPVKYYIVIADTDLTEHLLSSPKYLKKGVDYDAFRPWIGNGLLTSTGSYWQKRRKIITPTFHFKILEQFIPIFNTDGETLVKRLSAHVGKGVVDIYPFITAYTLDVICESAMGTSVQAQAQPDNEYVRAVKSNCNIFMDRSFSMWKQFDSLFVFSKQYYEQKKNLEIIHGFTRNVIEKRRNELLSASESINNKSTSDADEFGVKKKQAFLDLLLNSVVDGKPLTDDDIMEEVNTFMFEGHDTTASAIAFALYELSRNPDVQEKAFVEVRDVLGDDKAHQPTLQDLNNLKYLELVIKETLRLYPSVPMFARELEENVSFNGYNIPKGTMLLFLIYYMHRRGDLFKDPELFNPDRFSVDSADTKNPFAYVPFSAGPRNCIGQKFAMYELKATLSKLLRNFEFLPADPKDNIILSSEVVLKSFNGVKMRLKHRKY